MTKRVVFENQQEKIKMFQHIIHHKVRKLSHNNRIFRNERKSFENQKNSFDYFFHRYNCFLF